MIKSATQAGFKCVVANFRGCSGVKLTSPKIYWKCNWTDVKEPIEYIHAQYCSGDNVDFKKRNLYAYAVSLGAGMLTKYLFKSGDKCVLSGALNYGVFYEVEANVPFFKRSGWKFYDFALGYNYYNVLKAQEEELRDLFGNEKYLEFMSRVYENRFSLMDISEKAMCPLFGYNSVPEYYAETRPIGKLHQIRIPTMFFSSIDDPTINHEFNPYKEFENNENIIGCFTTKGGHCGHFTGRIIPRQWFAEPMIEFLEYLESRPKEPLHSFRSAISHPYKKHLE